MSRRGAGFWVAGLAGIGAGFFVGRSVGPAPIQFPEVDQGRSAAEMESAVSEALYEPRAFVRAATLARLFEGLTDANVEGAREAISARSGLGDPVDLQIFVAAWVALDPYAALDEIQTWPVKSRRRIGFNAAIREWAASGGGIQAGDYVQGLRDAELQRDAFGPLVRGWALSGDFDGALGLTQRLFHERDVNVVDGFVRGMLQVAGAERTLDLTRQVLAQPDGPFQQRLVDVTFNLAGRESPVLAATLLWEGVGESDPERARPSLDPLAKHYRTVDAKGAVEWLLRFEASPERNRALGESTGFWAIRDYEEAWAWFETERGPFAAALSDDDTILLTGLLRKQARVDPESAAEWLERLPEGEARDALTARVAYFWAGDDDAAATAWIDSLTLEEALLERVRESAARGREAVPTEPIQRPTADAGH